MATNTDKTDWSETWTGASFLKRGGAPVSLPGCWWGGCASPLHYNPYPISRMDLQRFLSVRWLVVTEKRWSLRVQDADKILESSQEGGGVDDRTLSPLRERNAMTELAENNMFKFPAWRFLPSLAQRLPRKRQDSWNAIRMSLHSVVLLMRNIHPS